MLSVTFRSYHTDGEAMQGRTGQEFEYQQYKSYQNKQAAKNWVSRFSAHYVENCEFLRSA